MHAYVRLLCVYMYCLCVHELVCVCVCVCMSVLRLFIRCKYAVARLIRTFDGKIFQSLFFSFARSCIFFHRFDWVIYFSVHAPIFALSLIIIKQSPAIYNQYHTNSASVLNYILKAQLFIGRCLIRFHLIWLSSA